MAGVGLFVAVPVEVTSATQALYDEDPSLWPSVHSFKTVEKIRQGIRSLTKFINAHGKNTGKRIQTARNKRKLLFAKLILVNRNVPPAIDAGFMIARQLFGLVDLRMRGDDPLSHKRESVTFLMELSKFIGSIWREHKEDFTIKA